MSVAPFSINGGSVESGGVASAFGRASPVSDDDEVAGMLAGVGAHVEPAVGQPPAADPFVMVGEIGSGAPELRLLHAAAACSAHHLHTEPRACGPLNRNLHQWSRAHPPPRPRRRRATPGARGPDDADDDADDADAAAGGGCAG